MDGEEGMHGWRGRDAWMERERDRSMDSEEGMHGRIERERGRCMDGEEGMHGWQGRDALMARNGCMDGEEGMQGWRGRDAGKERETDARIARKGCMDGEEGFAWKERKGCIGEEGVHQRISGPSTGGLKCTI